MESLRLSFLIYLCNKLIDDLIVYIQQPGTDRIGKLLGQIKHSISITNGDIYFAEVIQAAWNDFNKNDDFIEGIDSIALITGPLSAVDTKYVRKLLRQARYSENENDFITRIELGKFTNQKERDKLDVFRYHLKTANNNEDVSDEQLWRFLKSFHLLIYDLDIKEGVTLSLLHTLISQFSTNNAEDVWRELVDLVEWESENAGYITLDSIPDKLRMIFQKSTLSIPDHFIEKPSAVNQKWNTHKYASDLVTAILLGSWDENNSSDIKIVESLTGEDYSTWISRIKDILQIPSSPIKLNNGTWKTVNRKELIQLLGGRIFDDQIDRLKRCAVEILSEYNTNLDTDSFERPVSYRYKKGIKHSDMLRRGMAETLAMIANYSDHITNCSLDKIEVALHSILKETFGNQDWKIWASLNNELPYLAEAMPTLFLNLVDSVLQQTPNKLLFRRSYFVSRLIP